MKYITLIQPATASILVYGYMFDYLSNVYLSSGSVRFPSLTAVNNLTTVRRVSSICPPFSGYQLPNKDVTVVDKNRVKININNALSGSGLVEVILYNNAGYTKLSNNGYLINYNPATVEGELYTIDNSEMTTIDGAFVVSI